MNVDMYHNDKNKASLREQFHDALMAWNNTTSGIFDRMFCCAYNGHQVYEEAAELDFDVTPTDDFLPVDNSNQCTPKSATSTEFIDRPMGDFHPRWQPQKNHENSRQHQLMQQHYIFLEKKNQKHPSIKQIGRTKSFDDEDDDDAVSIRTATTASMNTRSSQSLNTMPTMISSATSVTSSSITRHVGNHHRSISSSQSSSATSNPRNSRPDEISVPHSDSKQKQKQQFVPKKQQKSFRGHDSPREGVVVDIRKMQSESLADLPYLTVTEGYRC